MAANVATGAAALNAKPAGAGAEQSYTAKGLDFDGVLLAWRHETLR
jgi:hypothetical protein